MGFKLSTGLRLSVGSKLSVGFRVSSGIGLSSKPGEGIAGVSETMGTLGLAVGVTADGLQPVRTESARTIMVRIRLAFFMVKPPE